MIDIQYLQPNSTLQSGKYKIEIGSDDVGSE